MPVAIYTLSMASEKTCGAPDRVMAWLGAAAFSAFVLMGSPAFAQSLRDAWLEADHVAFADGAKLPLAQWFPLSDAPRAAVIMLHGLNDYSGVFADAARQLAASGFVVYAYDQRGFGGTEERGRWVGGDVLAADVRRVADLVRARHAGVPLYAIGESMGGAVLLRALEVEPNGWLDGAVLLAPAVWKRRDMPWYQRAALGLLARTLPGIRFSPLESRPPSDDPEMERRRRADPLVITKTRVAVLSGVSDLMDEVTDTPTDVTLPLLILYGAQDKIVPAGALCRWAARLDPADPWQLAVYPSGWHALLRDRDAPTAFADLTSWLGSGGKLPSGLEVRPRDEAACLDLMRPVDPAVAHAPR